MIRSKTVYAYIKTFKDSPPQLENTHFKEMLDNSNGKNNEIHKTNFINIKLNSTDQSTTGSPFSDCI